MASHWLLERLTGSGRIPLRLALQRLTTWESILIQHALGNPAIQLCSDGPPDAPSVCVTVSALHGTSFWSDKERPPHDAEVIGWLRIPQSVLDMVDEETQATSAREAAEMRELDAILATWEESGELDRRLVELADLVERVETVFIFIGRDVFSKSDAGSNTLTRDGLLADLRPRPVISWRPADRLFVVAAHCLFTSGRSVRFEEFNGKQLSATALREYLLNRCAAYCLAAGREAVDLHGTAVTALAERVRDLMAEADASGQMRYRRINGLTFVKNEYLLGFPPPRDHDRLPLLVAQHGRRGGLRLSGNARTDMRAMTMAAVQRDARSGTSDAVEDLIATVVLSSVVETDADYGMSSGVRDLYSLRGAEPSGIDGVLALKKADFFCCCLPHTTRMSGLDPRDTVSIVWRAAQRMMYNRWHFVPGEFPRKDIPEKRHYFFPPQVPDIAEHAEHHHGGHTASRVRFSIRAPGAQVWHPPFRVFGNGFRGCYDIRLVRMEGPPFTLRELREAVRHCSLVDELWRTLAVCAAHDAPVVPAVRGFSRAWYESRFWERMHPYQAVAWHLTGPRPA